MLAGALFPPVHPFLMRDLQLFVFCDLNLGQAESDPPVRSWFSFYLFISACLTHAALSPGPSAEAPDQETTLQLNIPVIHVTVENWKHMLHLDVAFFRLRSRSF